MILGDADDGDRSFNGAIGFAAILNRVVTDGEASSITTALRTKFGF